MTLRSSAMRGWSLTAVLFLIPFTIYLQSLGHGFHYDDFHSIVRNPHIRSLESVADFFTNPRLFSENPESAMYRPVLMASYALSYAVGGDRPAGFHGLSLALHSLNAMLVFWMLLALRQSKSISFLAAALFAVHPLNSEAVNYVSSRSELLMASFFLASCLSYLHYRDTGRAGWYASAFLFAVLALLTKSVAVVLMGGFALCDWLLGGWRAVRSKWPSYLPFLALDIAYLAISRQIVDKALLQPARGLDTQLWTQLKGMSYYGYLSTVPVKLNVEHQFFTSRSPSDPAVFAAGLAIASIIVLLWRLRSERWLPFAAAWGILLTAPTIVVPLIVLVNEHRLYLASVGFALLLSRCLCALPWTPSRPRLPATWLSRTPLSGVAPFAVATFAIVLIIFTVKRSEVWSDELSLWQDSVVKSPHMVKPHLRSADALAGAGRHEEAETAYKRALELRPRHPAARNNLGKLYRSLGRLAEAEDHFRAVVATSPDNVAARMNLAGLLYRSGDWEQARQEYERALEYDAADGVALPYLGRIALQHLGDPELAIDYYGRALDRSVGGRELLLVGRGAALRALGDYDGAEADYRAALLGDPQLVDAWYNLGNLFSETHRYEEARQSFEKVIEIATDSQLSRAAAEQISRMGR